NPAVIIGIKNGDKLLLTKYRSGFSQNALVAGFTEFGETLEETVKREVKEETGLNVKNIRYYKSQPWGIASDILAGYYCEVDGDDRIKMDQHELRYAEWVKREDIILQNKRYSLTNEMMERFKLGIEK
ncbi:MAG: NUDIX domain-containing protein, partial [Erysipelotrichaceae bacterium]|nr:NUDIX domain-containing protein [Erysipelotrichaceae bacterium]